MKTKTLGIIMIALGIIMMLYTGFNYVTTENVVDLGPIQINKKENHPVQWSPIIGACLLIAGIVMLVIQRRNRS